MSIAVKPHSCTHHPLLSEPSAPISDGNVFYWRRDKKSFTTDQAAKHLTRSNSKFHDKNRDNQIVIGFNFAGGFTGACTDRRHG